MSPQAELLAWWQNTHLINKGTQLTSTRWVGQWPDTLENRNLNTRNMRQEETIRDQAARSNKRGIKTCLKIKLVEHLYQTAEPDNILVWGTRSAAWNCCAKPHPFQHQRGVSGSLLRRQNAASSPLRSRERARLAFGDTSIKRATNTLGASVRFGFLCQRSRKHNPPRLYLSTTCRAIDYRRQSSVYKYLQPDERGFKTTKVREHQRAVTQLRTHYAQAD